MKKIHALISALLIVTMLFGTMGICAFASATEPISSLSWSDNYTVSFSFDGAAKYAYTVKVNNQLIRGYGTTDQTTVSREKLLPYLTTLAQDAISQNSLSGNVSFDFCVVAKNNSGESISKETVISKTLSIEDVAAGKLSPNAEKWKYGTVSTDNATKLSNAFHAAFDPDSAEISASLITGGLSYESYIAALVRSASESPSYVFIGSLIQALRFGSVYSASPYTNVTLNVKKISEISVSVSAPTHGQSLDTYAKSQCVVCSNQGVTVVSDFNAQGIMENNTGVWVKKFYSGNEYQIPFNVLFDEGYAPAENMVILVNGSQVDYGTDEQFEAIGGFHCSQNMKAEGNFLFNISTFFHNLLMKIRYPHGMVA